LPHNREEKHLTSIGMCIALYIRKVFMRTTIVLDDTVVEEAFKYAKNIHTKKDLIDIALREFIQNHKTKDLREIRGKMQFAADYDFRKMRKIE
jgi:Arc/MetJ family transcription regulator